MNIHHISIYQKGPHLKSRHSFHLYIIKFFYHMKVRSIMTIEETMQGESKHI